MGSQRIGHDCATKHSTAGPRALGYELGSLDSSPGFARHRMCGLDQSPDLAKQSKQSPHLGNDGEWWVRSIVFCPLKASIVLFVRCLRWLASSSRGGKAPSPRENQITVTLSIFTY